MVVGAYGTTSEVSWLFLLSDWCLAIVIAAFFYQLWNRAGLELTLRARGREPAPDSPLLELDDRILGAAPSQPPVFEGDAAEIEIRLRSRFGSRGPVWVAGHATGRSITAGAAVVTPAGWMHVEPVGAMRRGPLDATRWSIHTSDPFGFFSGRRKSSDAEIAVAYPRFKSLAGRLRTRELEASVAAPRAGAGNELFGIREYRSGDSLRRIHWRSSARLGELVVREYEPPGVRTLGIFLDPSPSDPETADQIARIAASEAWDCIRQGGRVVLWAPGLVQSGEGRSRDLWSLLDWLARYPGEGGQGDAPEVSEAVMVVSSPAPAVIDEIEAARRRGAEVRGWVVGQARVDVDAPIETVGTRWPL